MTQLGPFPWSTTTGHPARLPDDAAPESPRREIRRVPDRAEAVAERGARRLVDQLVEDWQAHGRDWSRPGFQAVAVHRFGNWRMGIRSRLARAPFSALYRALFRVVRNVYGIELPDSARLGRRVVFEHQGGIVIHGNAVIGDDCIIRQGVTIGNRTLDRPLEAPRLGSRVNVGAGAKILGGVAVGDDAEIGANAVVRTDVGAGELAVGVPARLVPRQHRLRRDTHH